jgi:hypothetical protein
MDRQCQKTEVDLRKEEADKHREKVGRHSTKEAACPLKFGEVGLQRLEGCTGAMDLC